MKSFAKKMLSVFVSAALCCGLVPAVALASGADPNGTFGEDDDRNRQTLIDQFAARDDNAGAVEGEDSGQFSTTAWIKAEQLGFHIADAPSISPMTDRGDTATVKVVTTGALKFSETGAEEYQYEYQWFYKDADGKIVEASEKATTDKLKEGPTHTFELTVAAADYPAEGGTRDYYVVVTNLTEGSKDDATLGKAEDDTRAYVRVTYAPEYSESSNHYWNKADGINATDKNYLWSADGALQTGSTFTVSPLKAASSSVPGAWVQYQNDQKLSLQADEDGYALWAPYITDLSDASKDAYKGTIDLGFVLDGYLGKGDGSPYSQIVKAVLVDLGSGASADAVSDAIAKVLSDNGISVLWGHEAGDDEFVVGPAENVKYWLDSASGTPRVVATITMPEGLGSFGQFAVAKDVPDGPVDPDDPEANASYTISHTMSVLAADGNPLTGSQGNAVLGSDLTNAPAGTKGAGYTFSANINAAPAFYVDQVRLFVNGADVTATVDPDYITLSTRQVDFHGKAAAAGGEADQLGLSLAMFGLDPADYADAKKTVSVRVDATFKQKQKQAVDPAHPEQSKVSVSVVKSGPDEAVKGSSVDVKVAGSTVTAEADGSYAVPKDGAFQLFFSKVAEGYMVKHVVMKTTGPGGQPVELTLPVTGDTLPISDYAGDVELEVVYAVSDGGTSAPGGEKEQFKVSVFQKEGGNEVALRDGTARIDTADGSWTVNEADNVRLTVEPKPGYDLTGAAVTLGTGADAYTMTYDAQAAASILILNVSASVKAVYTFTAKQYPIHISVGSSDAMTADGTVSEKAEGGNVLAKAPVVDGGKAYISHGNDLVIEVRPDTADRYDLKSLRLDGAGGSLTLTPTGTALYTFKIPLDQLFEHGVLNANKQTEQPIHVKYAFEQGKTPVDPDDPDGPTGKPDENATDPAGGGSGVTTMKPGDEDGNGTSWTAQPADKADANATGNVVDRVRVDIDDETHLIYEFDHSKPASGAYFDPADYVKDVPGFDRAENPDGVFTYTSNDGRGIQFVFDANKMTVTFVEKGSAAKVQPVFTYQKTRKVSVKVAPGYGSGSVTFNNEFDWVVGVDDAGDLLFVILPDEGSDLDRVEMDPQVGFTLEDRTESGLSEAGQNVLAQGGRDLVRAAAVAPQTRETRDLMAALTGAETAWAATANPKMYEVGVKAADMDALDRDLLMTVHLKSLKKVTLTAAVAGGKGSIVEKSPVTIGIGEGYTFHFKPDAGYVVSAVQVGDGQREAYTAESYTFDKVERDQSLKVWFSPKPFAGSNTTAAKTLRHLQSLASTGDLNAPAMMLLLALACGALGVAIIANGRRRRAFVGGAPDPDPAPAPAELLPEQDPDPGPSSYGMKESD